MTIYIDDLNWPLPNGRKSCHLSAIPENSEDDWREELHTFAQSIGMKRAWYQERAGMLGHYDAMGSMIDKAIKAGAVPIKATKLLVMMKERDGFKTPHLFEI